MQSPEPCEVIVVDDGSRDNTAAVAKGFASRAKLVSLENGGVSRARNEGAKQAVGDLFLFLDSDDLLLSGALVNLTRSLNTCPSAGVAYGMVIERRTPPQHPRLNSFNFAEGSPPAPARANFWRNAIATPGAALVRRDIHQKSGGFVSGYEPLEDRDYFIKCGLVSDCTFCDTVVLDKRWVPASHGTQHAKRIFRGQRAQRQLKTWCQERGVDASWIPSDQEILRRALDEAVWRRETSILKPLREEAKKLGVRHLRSAFLAGFTRAAEPDWLQQSAR